jgi:NAD-dependent SIR2 family protein deacetylase
MLKRLALATRNFSFLAGPADGFTCHACNHLFPGKDRRRQVQMQFVDMCPDCARKGGEAEA